MNPRPRVLLIGDSIRLSYQDTVRARLGDRVEVWTPPENGQHTANLLYRFHDWIASRPRDLVLLNAGLWDCRRLHPPSPDNNIPLDHYRANLRALFRLIAAHAPGAKVAWIATTPVHYPPGHTPTPGYHREPADIAAYNAAAREECAAAGHAFLDLHALVSAAGPARLLGPDGVHFSADGARFLGEHVADFALRILDLPASPAPGAPPPSPSAARAARLDLEPILDALRSALAATRLAPGVHARWLGPERERRPDGTEANPYGIADAANILYTLGELPAEGSAERAGFVASLCGIQSPDTGLYTEATHHTYHVTAHCLAALELFDARPLHPLRVLHQLREPGALETFLDSLRWKEDPWNASHQGAGVFAALVIADEVSPEWQDRYFAWLRAASDPRTGYWRDGCPRWTPEPDGKPIFHHLAGAFHYLFNHEWAHRPLPHPAAMIDSTLRIWHERLHPLATGFPNFSDIDWVYCLTRPLRQCGHRRAEVHAALEDFAEQYVSALLRRVAADPVPFPDLHGAFGALCALAELQAALPGRLRSRRPLKLVLDRPPFI